MSWPNLTDLVTPAPADAPVGLVGVPLGIGSVTPGNCDEAPAGLRKVLRRIGRYDVDTGRELSSRVADHGDVALEGETIEAVTGAMVDAIASSVDAHALSLVIGGNNAVTRPCVHALGLPLGKVGLITLDAHFDMRGTEDGLLNGNPVRALLEDGLPGANVAQVGLLPFANSKVMHDDARAAGNRVITLAEAEAMGVMAAISAAIAHLDHVEAIVVDCDIDVIDRAQFPGAPGARPGGMQARDFFAAVRRLAAEPRVRIVDLVEWDPPLDGTDLSSLVAGRWMAEALAGFESR
ncbi:arginase family protein [Sphingomicrobium aestuariivivum]|uniref:arginase family protein n=1 Tax=Sphingomicrobium aestuariivivum TaxID=1582356 RepID=UPI001FD6845A|nr:arginase family protein [Sphingomicrobium aestuariivivum]MCJ8191302.1 arginase family protein [Sphingomicrobium aestuariivivum]